MLKKLALLFGAVLLLGGVFSYVPGATTSDAEGRPLLFGVFLTDALYGVTPIIAGVVGLLACSSERYSKWFLQLFGLVYGVIALVGLLQSDTVLGLFQINLADNLLHVTLAICLLCAGFGLKANGEISGPKPPLK